MARFRIYGRRVKISQSASPALLYGGLTTSDCGLYTLRWTFRPLYEASPPLRTHHCSFLTRRCLERIERHGPHPHQNQNRPTARCARFATRCPGEVPKARLQCGTRRKDCTRVQPPGGAAVTLRLRNGYPLSATISRKHSSTRPLL